jgi:hypothetical protein
MKSIAISMGIDYIFQKKPFLFFIYFSFFFLKKNKLENSNPHLQWLADHPMGDWPTTYSTTGGRTTPRVFGGGTGHLDGLWGWPQRPPTLWWVADHPLRWSATHLVFNFLFYSLSLFLKNK